MSKKFGFLKDVTPSGREQPADQPPLQQPRRGRPPGKRTDPAFEQVTIYIRKDTHRGVKIALLQEAKKREFSVLVEELLAAWLAKTNQISKSATS